MCPEHHVAFGFVWLKSNTGDFGSKRKPKESVENTEVNRERNKLLLRRARGDTFKDEGLKLANDILILVPGDWQNQMVLEPFRE